MQQRMNSFAFLIVVAILIATNGCSPPVSSPKIQVTEIKGVGEGDALLPGTQKYIYVEASGVGDLIFTWEDITGVLQANNNSILNYVVPNMPGEAFLKVTVRTKSGDQKSKIVRFQIAQPLATPSLAPPPPTITAVPTVELIPTPVVIEYTAISSDTLSGISKELLKSVVYADAIGKANCVNTLKTGQKIIIKYYVVQSMDYLRLIADRFGMSVQSLQFINDFTSEIIYPGQIIIFPVYEKCQ